MKYLVILLTFIFISFVVSAQSSDKGTLTGVIVDVDGHPVVGAVVLLEELKLAVTSDENGKYVIAGQPFGTYTLVISAYGIKTKRETVTLSKSNQKLNLNLEHDHQEIAEVVIEAKSEKRELEEQGYAVNVIDTKGVELQSIQANELLDRSTGVRVRQAGGLGSNIQYNINGLSGNSIRVFIDGIPISSYGPSFSLNSIPNSMIERIEVYKGVVPAHLSDDALGGAINVVLKKSMQNNLTASYSYGSFNTHQANINGGYRNQKNGLTVRASTFYNYSDNSYDVWGDKVYVTNANGKIEKITAKRFHDTYRSLGGKFDVGFTNVKWADQLMLSGVFSDMKRDIQHGATMETVYGNRYTTQNTQLFSLTYAKQDLFTKGLAVSLFSSYSMLNRQVFDTIPYMYNWLGNRVYDASGKPVKWASGAEGSSPTLQTSLEKNFSSRVNLSYAITPRHKLSVNYMLTRFSRDQDDAMFSQDERNLIDTRYLTKGILGATYESKFFGERLKSSLFYKQYSQNVSLKDRTRDTRTGVITAYDYSKLIGVSGYGLALSYTIIPHVMLTASAEKAVRLPESTEVFGNIAENIDPSYELKPESSNNLNLGFNLGVFRLKKHGLSLNTNFFYRDTKDMIRQGVPSQVSETYRFENIEKVISKGFDSELSYNYNQKFNYTLGVSVFNARVNNEYDLTTGRPNTFYGQRLRNSPYFTANSNLRYNINDLLQKGSFVAFYYNLGYVHTFFRDWQRFGDSNKDDIPTQIVHDLGVAYTFPKKKLTLSFDAKNIFNRQVFDNWALQKPGRAFYVKISYKII